MNIEACRIELSQPWRALLESEPVNHVAERRARIAKAVVK